MLNRHRQPRTDGAHLHRGERHCEGEDSTDLKYTNAPRTLSVSGTTLDRNAEPYDYDGWVEVVVKPGLVKNVSGAMQVEDSWGETHWYVQARGGQVNVNVEVASSFGNTRAWLTAVPDPNDPGSKASMATGVTESFAVPNPTIPGFKTSLSWRSIGRTPTARSRVSSSRSIPRTAMWWSRISTPRDSGPRTLVLRRGAGDNQRRLSRALRLHVQQTRERRCR